jgi:hypothetical protein
MEPKAGRQVKGFITVMNLMESPEKIVMVIYHMPEVDRQIIKKERHHPLDGSLFKAV